MARTSSSRRIDLVAARSSMSVPEYLPKRMLSPAFTSRANLCLVGILPLPRRGPRPAGLLLAVSGMMMPPLDSPWLRRGGPAGDRAADGPSSASPCSIDPLRHVRGHRAATICGRSASTSRITWVSERGDAAQPDGHRTRQAQQHDGLPGERAGDEQDPDEQHGRHQGDDLDHRIRHESFIEVLPLDKRLCFGETLLEMGRGFSAAALRKADYCQPRYASHRDKAGLSREAAPGPRRRMRTGTDRWY